MKLGEETGTEIHDQRREGLDVVQTTHLQILLSRAVHLRHRHVLVGGTVADALRHAFVDGSQLLAPVAPRSEEVDQNHLLRGEHALEILHSLDHGAVELCPHLLGTAQLQHLFH